ncbi:hypothetical protein ACHRVK_03625 [Flavobacterium plurextorum]|uniref:hypothetical protein n=1 Tax=Flavobacterium plurextorum TaxID=1114867 RepID=UPI0037584CC2
MEDNITDEISPEKAKQILSEDGIDVTVEQAKTILEFLYLMSEIVVNQYLNADDNL